MPVCGKCQTADYVVRKVSKSPTNPGRPYWACGGPCSEGKPPTFICWTGEPIQTNDDENATQEYSNAPQAPQQQKKPTYVSSYNPPPHNVVQSSNDMYIPPQNYPQAPQNQDWAQDPRGSNGSMAPKKIQYNPDNDRYTRTPASAVGPNNATARPNPQTNSPQVAQPPKVSSQQQHAGSGESRKTPAPSVLRTLIENAMDRRFQTLSADMNAAFDKINARLNAIDGTLATLVMTSNDEPPAKRQRVVEEPVDE